MAILDTTHKRKSAIITATLMLLLLYLVFNFGMKYLDPPEEYGVAINFGNTDYGKGEPVKNVQSAPKNDTPEEVVEEIQEEVVEEVAEPVQEEVVQESVEENVITEETAEEVPVVKKTEEPQKVEPQKEVKKETPKEVKEAKPTETKPVEEVKEVKKEKPKPSKATTDALNNLLNGNASDGATKGEGDDDKNGVKGKENGNPDASKYYGNTGTGSGGNYRLGGRKALSKPIKQPDCEEEGTVVVSIFVNQNGQVLKAIPGARGTTNSAPCLFKAAKDAAMATKWNADGEAPSQQKGTIIYKFSLSK